jgi:hypothetical protein
MGIIRWLLVYIYMQSTLTCSTTFCQNLLSSTTNPRYLFVLLCSSTLRQEGKKVRILSQLREIGLPIGDANRTLFLKQWPT